ncbi:hypothetical protein QZH41_018199, partial [Actinostola sp. cb2023]
DDDCETEWLRRGIDKIDNPFPSALPSKLFGSQRDLNHFTFYVFERRYGRTEFLINSSIDENVESLDGVYAVSSSPRAQDDSRLLVQLNEFLDEQLRWFSSQPLTIELLESLKYAVAQAHSMPVVRNHTCVHILDWLKTRSDNGFSQQVFPLIKALILSGITDVWSAIRNSCVARLAQTLGCFTLDQAHIFYGELIQICQAKESSWQAIEGAVMGMTTLVRRFNWTGVLKRQLNNNTKEEISEYMLKFGSSEQSSLPKFIMDSVHSVLYSLLAHSQLSIRDQATNAFSSILSRCEFQEAFFAFQDVISRLCKGIIDCPQSEGNTILLPHVAVLRSDFKFLKAYEAEGLLGVCVFLIKHIPPGYLLTTWPLYFSTFNIYLMHPASTVRQATSAVFKYLERPSKTAGHLVSQAWEWREGRLLAYELILKFLISNHIHYVFPTFALSRSSASASASVDENLIRRQSDVSPPTGQPLKSNSFAAISSQMSSFTPMTIKENESVYIEAASESCHNRQNPSQIREAWSRQAKRSSSFSIINDDATRTRKLIRQYSVTCQKYPKRPFRPPRTPGVSLANSLLCQAADLEIDTTNNTIKTSLLVSGSVCNIVKSLASPLGKIDQENSDFLKYKEMRNKTSKTLEDLPRWATQLELETLTCILTQILFQTIECLADSRWELRRMGQQLLPLVTETIRWFNMAPLGYLWDNHLTRENTLLCYGGCIALKNSISHAGRLIYYLDQPPTTWKDPESCSRVAMYIVNETKKGIQKWLVKVHKVVQYPGYDKLTVVAMETIMLSHLYFYSSLDVAQPLSVELKSFCKELNRGFLVPLDGFLSCSTRIESSEKNAQQVVIFPVLVHYIEWFSEETALCHSLVDGLHRILTQTQELMKSSEQRQELHLLVQTYFDYALVAVSDAVSSIKALDIAVLRQLLELTLKVCEFIDQPSLSHIFKAISEKLDYEPDLLRLVSEDTASRTNTPELYILNSDIPTSPVDEPAIPVEEEDDETVDSLGVLRESEALDASHGSGRGQVRLEHQEEDESDMSDWDSWEEEEEDQSALIAVFSDFLQNLQNMYEAKSDQ